MGSYSFLRIISFSIIILFCQSSFGEENCNFFSLDAEKIRLLKTKIRDRMKQRIDTLFENGQMVRDSDIIVPVKIFGEWENQGGIPTLYGYISTSFWVHTTKNQELCHPDLSNSICDYNLRFPIYFDKKLIKDLNGNPISEECILNSSIIMQIINRTKNYYLGAIEIFRFEEIIHKWKIKNSNSNLKGSLN